MLVAAALAITAAGFYVSVSGEPADPDPLVVVLVVVALYGGLELFAVAIMAVLTMRVRALASRARKAWMLLACVVTGATASYFGGLTTVENLGIIALPSGPLLGVGLVLLLAGLASLTVGVVGLLALGARALAGVVRGDVVSVRAPRSSGR